MQTFLAWLKGLLSVAVSSAAGGVAIVIVDPSNFNLHTGMSKLLEVCVTLAIIHAALYLQHSPLPGVTVNGNSPK